jgi:hypothetical protein
MAATNGMQKIADLQKDIEDVAKIAVDMLNVSRFTPQERTAWIALVPHMSYDDIVKFLDLLERSTHQVVDDALAPLVTKFHAIRHAASLEKASLVTQALQDVEDLASRVAQEEKKGRGV